MTNGYNAHLLTCVHERNQIIIHPSCSITSQVSVAGMKEVDSGNNGHGSQRKDEKSCKCKCNKKTSDKETVYRQLNIQVMQITIKNHGKLLVMVGSLFDFADVEWH